MTLGRWLAASLIVLVLAILGLVGYVYWHTSVLEIKQFANLKVAEYVRSGSRIVTLSGFCNEPAIAIKKVETETEGSVITVLAYGYLVRGNATGNLNYDVPVIPALTEIRFGKQRALVWTRERGALINNTHPSNSHFQ